MVLPFRNRQLTYSAGERFSTIVDKQLNELSDNLVRLLIVTAVRKFHGTVIGLITGFLYEINSNKSKNFPAISLSVAAKTSVN
jgi:hypothetical protein